MRLSLANKLASLTFPLTLQRMKPASWKLKACASSRRYTFCATALWMGYVSGESTWFVTGSFLAPLLIAHRTSPPRTKHQTNQQVLAKHDAAVQFILRW